MIIMQSLVMGLVSGHAGLPKFILLTTFSAFHGALPSLAP